MGHVKLTINDQVILDDSLGHWQTNPPDILAEQLKANAQPEPWMRAVMLTLAEAGMKDQPATIDVNTKPGEWMVRVIDGPHR